MEKNSQAIIQDKKSSNHIIQSLLVNVIIVVAKGFAAFMTGSGAMLAETIHSSADCANQVLLLLGMKQSGRPADEQHPFGYGMSVYFWSFMVAMLLFSIGGMFSIYEGIHKYNTPEPVHEIAWGIGILLFAIGLEGYATYSNIIELNKRKGNSGFFNYLRTTKDSDLIVIFGENSAAVIGLFLALTALLASYYTGDSRYDAIGSLAIGIVLILVAIFLAVEVKSLLIGESADSIILETIEAIIEKELHITQLLNCRTIQQGPGEVLVCIKIKCSPDLNTQSISRLINHFENELRTLRPEVKWLYVEPDLQEWK
ncbi:cation diffusion facilitator family transporter [Flavobacterium sp. CG_9.10]|uniref:cation diffusion facilitator family transporter n=1 Tax=Flavobacterium sp. CG_9.10 TaxID=2787729 RepID=UPI0018CA0C99|nr:cation diffusion facilitator family transporter [Flavobacterium sp. CG_9.10]MBG6111955.1 cation diffusion facilitator family transporter [Flavobacterium sp. CG_9.10]